MYAHISELRKHIDTHWVEFQFLRIAFPNDTDGDDHNDDGDGDDDFDDDEVGVFVTIVFDSIVGVTPGQEGRAGGGALLEAIW